MFISPQSGRLTIAQRFIAGIAGKTETKSVKRTAEQSCGSGLQFSHPFHGLRILQLSTIIRPLLRTDKPTFWESLRYPELHLGTIFGLQKQLGYGPVNDRVLKVGAKLSQRHECKATAMKLRMGQGK